MEQVRRSGQLENTPPSRPQSVWQQLLVLFREHKLVAASQLALLVLALVFLTTTIMLWNDASELQTAQQQGRMSAVRLNSTGVIPAAEGYLTLSGDRLSGGITLDQVPELGESRQYQLWLVKGGVRTSAALLSVDERGYGGGRVHAPEPLSHYSTAEVTIEPAGGSPQPTSDVIMTAELPQE
jgi:anti-sigma-K factor RskA